MGPDVVHLALGDNTQVNVAARAQVIKDTCSDGVSHQQLGLLLLWRDNNGAQMKTNYRTSTRLFESIKLLLGLCVVLLWTTCEWCTHLHVRFVAVLKHRHGSQGPRAYREEKKLLKRITDLTLFMCSAQPGYVTTMAAVSKIVCNKQGCSLVQKWVGVGGTIKSDVRLR